jgi:electron transfer flavoprotein beta subunit
MKVLVCVKQVLAIDDEVVLRDDGSDVDPTYLEASLNEWDSFAIEEALRLREAHAGEVFAATVGPAEAEAVLRRALAQGADTAIRVAGDAFSDPFTVGDGLASLAERLRPDLILTGAQSSDSANAATGSVIAGLLGLPCVAIVSAIRADLDARVLEVARELGGGVTDRLQVALPAVLTVQTGINKPRYANLRAIKLAERESIEVHEAGGTNAAYRVRRLSAPTSGGSAQSLGADVSEAAAALARLIKERTR